MYLKNQRIIHVAEFAASALVKVKFLCRITPSNAYQNRLSFIILFKASVTETLQVYPAASHHPLLPPPLPCQEKACNEFVTQSLFGNISMKTRRKDRKDKMTFISMQYFIVRYHCKLLHIARLLITEGGNY